MRLRLYEEMTGHHEFTDGGGPAGRHPFAFRVGWGPERLREWLDPRHPGFLWSDVAGEVRIGGLCEWTPCRGSLALEYLGARRIRYAFDLEVEGTVYRYLGDKVNLRLWNLPVSHTTCFGVLTKRATGRLVSTSVTRFHLRRLPRMLRRPAHWSVA